MNDELMLFTSLDQSISTKHDLILDQVQASIDESVRIGDPSIALGTVRDLVAIIKISGIGLAKVLYLLKKSWHRFEISGDFIEIIHEVTGLHSHTIERYVKVWAMYEENSVPENIAEQFQQRNIMEQIPVAFAIAQGHTLDQEDWQEILDAPDLYTIGRVLRDIKGQPPRKSSLQLVMDNMGTLWAYQDRERYFIGSLEINDEEKTVQKAIERLVKNGGVITG